MNQLGKNPLGRVRRAVPAALILLLLVQLLAGCGSDEEAAPAVPVAQASRAQTTVTVVVPTAAPTGAAPAADGQTGTEAEEPPAETTPAPTAPEAPAGLETAALLPGLVYRTEDALWQLDAAGEPQPVATNSDLTLSPAGDRGVYLAEGDVWVVDLASGTEQNVTAGSGRTHVSARWWPARPDTLVLGSWGEGEQGPNSGKLTLVGVDGSNYRLAHPDGDLSYAAPAPGPDGQTIAYDEAGAPWLYHIDGGAQPFTPATYLPRDVEVPHGASPAWAPDGNRLAWMAAVQGGGYGNDQGWDIALAIFDLGTATGTIIHPYQPVGRGGWIAPARWSPDGGWLLFSVESTESEEQGLWVTAADGNRESKLAPLANAPALWSPPGTEAWQNGAFLLLAAADEERPARLIARESWAETAVSLPEGAVMVEWRSLE